MDNPKDLPELITELNERLVGLERFVDTNDQQIREALNDLKLTVGDIKTMIYGNPKLRLKGQADRMDALERMVEEIVVSRKAERDRLRGIQIGLGLTAFTGLSTLITLITQLWQ